MSADGLLPPGVTSRDLARYLDGPEKLRCIGCGLDFPTAQLDDDEVCAKCREEDAHAQGVICRPLGTRKGVTGASQPISQPGGRLYFV